MSSSVTEKIERIKARLPSHIRQVGFIGCTEQEIEKLKETQYVTYLPEIYIELLRLLGKRGLGQALGRAYADYEDLLVMKTNFAENMVEAGLQYPHDAFIFWGDQQGCGYRFFRTKSNEDDPPVYEYIETFCFHKIGERLSDFIFTWVNDSDTNMKEARISEILRSRSIELYFDPDKDTFYTR